MSETTDYRLETRLIHNKKNSTRFGGAVSLPIFQSSTFEFEGQKNYQELKYIRLSNTPNHLSLHEKLATMEDAEAALVTASGMAAIATTLLGLLKTGDHLLVQNCVYGGTYELITKDLPEMGISYDWINPIEGPESWEKLRRPNTKAIYVEAISNPLLHIPRHPEIVRFAQAHGLTAVIDNTFATPLNFRPIRLGYDIAVHSCTKFLNGHSDLVAGAIIGSHAKVQKILPKLLHIGGSLNPFDCFLLERGLKTFPLRMRQHNANAMELAQFLETRPQVRKVFYPGLLSHPQHTYAKAWFAGGGGVVSFELSGGAEVADQMIRRLKLAISAPSLGGAETLITRPSTTSHVGLTAEERRTAGISDGLIRVAVGIEAIEDLKSDLERHLANAWIIQNKRLK